MSLQEKMIVSLIDATSIKKEDFSSSLFKGFYNSNINSPFLDNHIFILFEYKTNAESVDRDARFLKSPNLYKSEFVKIKNQNCVLYTFCITNSAIKDILNNSMSLKADDLLKIYKFWNFEDKDINNYTIKQKVDKLFVDKEVPEYDYQPNWEDIFTKKKAGLSI